MYLNKAIIIGNLTRDPETKALPSGIKVTTLSVATNRVWKDKSGARQESTDYHNVVVFGRQAETTSQYLKKGSSLLVEGRLQTRSWDGTDGQKRYRTEIVADRIQFGQRSGGAGSSSESKETGSKSSSKPSSDDSKDVPADTIDYPEEEINPDDIPF
jgi:single-strand DNA-binding protein